MSARRERFVHPDASLQPGRGVTYGVRYVGSVPVLASTRSLKAEQRNQVTRAAICLCCEAAGLIMPGRKRHDRSVAKLLGNAPSMQFSGWSANITVTTLGISIVAMETLETIADHNLVSVSFASGGDADTMDFVAYVAKDALVGRSCHVIECPGGLASDVVSTIGQAFELRHKGFAAGDKQPPATAAAPATEAAAAHQRPGSDAESQRAPTGAEAPVLPPRSAAVGMGSGAAAEPWAQPWYHGRVSRQEAEAQLLAEGDFLVRCSGSGGQFVLSGRLAGQRYKHLLLVDPDGRVRTRDRAFDSVEQLVSFHVDTQAPIVSDGAQLLLRRAAVRQ